MMQQATDTQAILEVLQQNLEYSSSLTPGSLTPGISTA
jgi:hypothetical protein